MSKSLIKLVLTIIGLVFFIVFIWFRFLRKRLPKDIPFDLTEYGCVILIYICCLYLFVIIMLIITVKTKNNILSLIIDSIFKPLKAFDESIKETNVITYYHEKFMKALSTKTLNYIKIYYLFNILPRLILVIALSIDTFYFHHLEHLYKIILFGLIPFLYKYFIHSLKYAKELFTLQLELITQKIHTSYSDGTDEYNTDSSFLDVREFVNIQTKSIYNDDHKYYAACIPTRAYATPFPRGTDFNAKLAKHCRLLDIIIAISLHLEYFDEKHNYNTIIKYIKVAIFSNYFICWSYILYVSIHTLPHDAFDWLWVIQDTKEAWEGTGFGEIADELFKS